MGTYSKEELAELQKVNLEMAKYFVEFCNKYNLLCYFCGGGCIGAVRHKGFIPWDDDLDFFMPRNDYELLARLWPKGSGRKYVISKADKNYRDHNQYITIRDTETTMIKPYQADLDIVHGVGLDIFPLDGCPNNKLQRYSQMFWACVHSLFCTEQIPKSHGKIIYNVARKVLALFPEYKEKYRIWKFAEKQMSKYEIDNCQYITELCAGPGYMKNRYPKEAFSSAKWLPFEDTKMPVPIDYDSYLKIAFGNYMELPSKEKRVPHHDAIKLDLQNSYKKYERVYYCVKK